MEFIQATTLVHLKIRIWSGEKKADRALDLRLGKGGQVPPQKLLDIGRKKIYSPKALDPFIAIRKAAERVCLQKGTRFMGGYAVLDESLTDKIEQLNQLKIRFEQELESFSVNFETTKEQWISENQEYEHIFRNQIPDIDTVKKAFIFEFTPYKLGTVSGHEPDANEFANQVLHEVGLTASKAWKQLLKRTSAISSKSLKKQLEPMVTKLEALSFGNGRVLSLLNEFTVLMNSIPNNEKFDRDRPLVNQVISFLSMVGDADKLDLIIQGDISVSSIITNTTADRHVHDIPSSSTQQQKSDHGSAVAGFYF